MRQWDVSMPDSDPHLRHRISGKRQAARDELLIRTMRVRQIRKFQAYHTVGQSIRGGELRTAPPSLRHVRFTYDLTLPNRDRDLLLGAGATFLHGVKKLPSYLPDATATSFPPVGARDEPTPPPTSQFAHSRPSQTI